MKDALRATFILVSFLAISNLFCVGDPLGSENPTGESWHPMDYLNAKRREYAVPPSEGFAGDPVPAERKKR